MTDPILLARHGDIECLLTGLEAGERERELLPQPVQAARHEVVHQVVLARHGIEHATHATRFVLPVDLFKAEIGATA